MTVANLHKIITIKGELPFVVILHRVHVEMFNVI